MKIIVTGSLGNVSQPLTKILIQNGHQVTVISSKSEKKASIEALGAIAAIGSVENVNFLTAAFNGADAVFAMVPPTFTAPDPIAYTCMIGDNYARAIEASRIKRVVYLSSWGAHLPQGTGFIVGHHRAEELLNELQDVTITFLRACSFYTNLFQYINMIKGAGSIFLNYGGDDKTVLVSPMDIAAAAADELEKVPGGKNIRYVASDERTCNEIAEALGSAINRPDLQWLTISDAQAQAAAEKNGMPANFAAKWVELNAAIHHGLLRQDYDLNKPTNMGKVKLEDFAQDFAAAFNQK
jgi:uncharacterized protein YbjT (DUF2867 family)